MTIDEQYQQYLEQAKKDQNVLGFFLTGGRGKGFVTSNSDYDIYIIVDDDYVDAAKKKYPSSKKPHKFDIYVHSMESFMDYAALGSSHEWDRYNFTYIKTLIDKTYGEIQKIIDEKGIIPKDKIKEITRYNLDVYINHFYRSMKNNRDGNVFASQLDATESVQWLIAFVFSIEGRMKPFSKYIEWALEKHPLEFLPWSKAEFISILKKILQTGDTKLQKEVFQKICGLAIAKGYKDLIDEWEGCYFGLDK